MISVVIPLYNKQSSIVSTLNTVLNQRYQDFEIVVVDDGSTDHSADEVRRISDHRIRLVSQPNAGVSAARNRGIEEAKGVFIAFLDADDEWHPDYLATQMSLVGKYPNCSVFATNYKFRESNTTITSTIIRKLKFNGDTGILDNYFEVASCSHPPLWTSAVMVRKSAIQSVGGFPVGIKSGEDLLTWARLAVNGPIAYSKQAFAIFVRDEQLFNKDQLQRTPEKEDVVGVELKKLYAANLYVVGLNKYIALWHKMRTRIFLDKGNRKEAIKECFISIKYDINIKILFFLFLTFLPLSLSRKIFKNSNTR